MSDAGCGRAPLARPVLRKRSCFEFSGPPQKKTLLSGWELEVVRAHALNEALPLCPRRRCVDGAPRVHTVLVHSELLEVVVSKQGISEYHLVPSTTR